MNFENNLEDNDADNLIESEISESLKFDIDSIINNNFNLPEGFTSEHVEAFQEKAQERFIDHVDRGRIDTALKIKELFNLSEEFIQKATQEVFIKRIKYGDIDTALKIKEKFNLSEEFIQKATQERFIYIIKYNCITYPALKIKETFNLSEEFINSPEAQNAAQEGFIYRIGNCDIDNALEIKEIFYLSEEFIQKAAQEGFINDIKSGYIDTALKIKEVFNLSEKFTQKVAQERFIGFIRNGDIDNALEINETFNLSEEFINSPEAQKAAQEGFIYIMKYNYNINNALEIKELFNLSESKILEDFMRDGKIKEYLDLIKQEFPEIYSNISTNVNKITSFLKFINNPEILINTLKNNSFLGNALIENNKHGSKLVTKYLELDAISSQNISSLYEWKEEIMKQNPEINPNSIEFRKLIQDRIAQYKNNPKIIEEIKEAGIDCNEWLNYSKEENFILGENENISISEQLSQPLNRTLEELLPDYVNSLDQSLEDYEKELNNTKVLSSEQIKLIDLIRRIEEEIQKEKQEGNNERKIQGMEKGLSANKQKLEKLKDITAKELLQSSIIRLNSQKDNIYFLDKELNEAEEELNKEFSKEIKVKINQTKEKLQKEVNDFLNSFTDFREKELSLVLSQALKKERAESIIQEVEERLHELLSHFNTDVENIKSIFNPEVRTNDLEGRHMSIKVWDRNPDIDLYQGNYSPCCISIESGCGSSHYESAIADYLTDPGIQIVNIVDREKQIPVCACWLWAGRDKKEGKPALVIDNIEANTDYSNKYQEQFKDEIKKYIEDYANSIGAETIVMGLSYNDVKLNTEDHNKKYVKIGPNNRHDGYYLEAEEERVRKLI